jgi:hypothetical protein
MNILRKACMDCLAGTAEKIAAGIREYTWNTETDGELEKILKAACSYDYEDALEEIELFLEKHGAAAPYNMLATISSEGGNHV